MNKNGLAGDALKDIILWIIFLVVGIVGVWFLLKKLET